jgi:GalNAc-alpha-(1->4)-GalNAc-alpha-(1->3)-diNAcBac-PP-undecaprenol alpha-1,4-N-acetyl-D-galactosaminyltransferase
VYQNKFKNQYNNYWKSHKKYSKGQTEVSKENIILTVGRLIESKHHDQLIDIFLRINKPGWKLVIVGDDAIKQKNKTRLQKIIDQNNAADRIILTGNQRTSIPTILKVKFLLLRQAQKDSRM